MLYITIENEVSKIEFNIDKIKVLKYLAMYDKIKHFISIDIKIKDLIEKIRLLTN